MCSHTCQSWPALNVSSADPRSTQHWSSVVLYVASNQSCTGFEEIGKFAHSSLITIDADEGKWK